ncbi:MAG: phospholipase D family protein [Hydrogenophilales bacterium 16-64-46]|nr:MAG: phospholipase D family protein [Hydrogenophilales bacterium 16-64-46]OZA40184.1 MAG: phospholipase D family protein [Hydrogenophilales bacterium 17-64-34]HQT00465.1 phospholipase D family protein [Thiobacillus sp.]
MSLRPERLLAGLLLILALAACAPTLNLAVERVPSHAHAPSADTPLGAALAAQLPVDASGFHLLADGHAALAARLALAARASRTLDVQYYLFHHDDAGKWVAAALLEAAARGVRVRVLIDDIDTADKELGLATLNAHPNIEVRLFNPFHTRSSNLLIRGWQALTESVRLNRRMHNKAFIADNQIGITGGRNIGNEYFDANPDLAFVDLDLMAAGPIVDAMSRSFDAYWNSEAATPAAALPMRVSQGRLARATERLRNFHAERAASDYGRRVQAADPLPALFAGERRWIAAPADLIVDPPDKALNPEKSPSDLLVGQLAGLWIDPTRRALIVSPYFVPGPMGMAYFRYWRHTGVDISVLTNAYAANDVPLVHAGYANYREALLDAGVKLFELKPVAEPIGGRLRDLSHGSSRASLHAKTFVFDDTHVFIGTFNFDPRSALLNTEMGIVVHSPELARQVTALAEDAMRPERSYLLELETRTVDRQLTRQLLWHDRHQGSARTQTTEPDTTPVQRGLLRTLQALPIEQHL